jgi:hypothetical protein
VVYDVFDDDFLLLEQEGVAYEVSGPAGQGETAGLALPGCLATTLVASLAASTQLAAGFVAAMKAWERPA